MKLFNCKTNQRIRIYISVVPRSKGGGINSFANNMANWLRKNSKLFVYEKNILRAHKVIAIADKISFRDLQKAKQKGCFIIHRLDEHFEQNEDKYRSEKHRRIIEFNKFADITVYQSQFVYQNVHPHLKPPRYTIILNGGDRKWFYPAKNSGDFIGHVAWSYHPKKRFDLVYDLITRRPDLKFLLVGSHSKSQYDFYKFRNVIMVRPVSRKEMVKYYHKMRVLYFPSVNDPCPNTAVEAVLSGVPVCFNPDAGTKEIVRDCGESLERFEYLLQNLSTFRERCFKRKDLYFDTVAQKYLKLG